MTKEAAKQSVISKFNKIVNSNSKPHNAYLLVHSDKLGIHWSMAHGYTDDKAAHPEQPYHTASVAKSFTGVIIAMLVEEGKISYTDPISKYLPEKLLKGLHIYKGKEYSKDIQIWHLVSNTSGLPDYFEGKTKEGRFLEILLRDQDRVWTPEETIEWSTQHLRPKFTPGNGCFYTNTGFNLLGLIIEKVKGKPYVQVLHEYIFQRLNMEHSSLAHFSEPKTKGSHPIAKLNLMGTLTSVGDMKSSTSIYAAGQAISTSEDLLKFMKALKENRLLTKESLATMMQWRKMRVGIDYGYGLMRVRMLAFAPKYNAWGHLGSTGSFMLYNETMDGYIIGSFNKTGFTGPSIRFAFHVLRCLNSLNQIGR